LQQIAEYESSASDAVSSDVTTLFAGTLPEVQDDDVSDSHTYALAPDSNVTLSSTDIDTTKITNLEVSIDKTTGDYTVSGNFNALAAGETVTITFQYVAIDDSINQTNGESNTSAPATVTLTITGTNDQPVVSNVEVSATETNGTDIFTFEGDLKLVATDADVNDGHTFYAVMDNNETEEGESVTYTIESDADITIDNIIVNTNGTYSITGDFNALAVGETATITFQYYAVDDSFTQANGESNTSELKTVTITVTGTNDAPVATVEDNFGVNEDSIVYGQLVADDIDNDDDSTTLTYSLVGDAPAGFTLDSNGNYTFDASDEAYQSLAKGETKEVTFTWIATDSHDATTTEQTVTITVTGTNDAPVAEVDTNSVIERGG